MSVSARSVGRAMLVSGRRQLSTAPLRSNTFTPTDAILARPHTSKFSRELYFCIIHC